MHTESSKNANRCLPDGGCKEVFEWQKWNIDKTQSHKHTAWLKMWSNRWHFNSQCLLGSFEEADKRLSPADFHCDLYYFYPETLRAPVTLLWAGLKREKPSFIYWAITLQQYLQSSATGFLHFHYQQDLFICFAKWLCCYRLFSESLSLHRADRGNFNSCIFLLALFWAAGCCEGWSRVWGFDSRRQKEQSDLDRKETTARFSSSVSLINVS